MGKFIDITGQVFGRWTVESQAVTKKSVIMWYCLCVCGEKRAVASYRLRDGRSKSCGCLNKEIITTHGMSQSAEYSIWQFLRYRCYDPKNKGYKNYGGRGIKVCDRWLEGFENFYEDMGKRPSPQHSIERIDNDGDYCPENCKWATVIEQRCNTRANNEIIGVCPTKSGNYAWRVKKNRKSYSGTCETIGEAAVAYDNKCEEIHNYRPNKTER